VEPNKGLREFRNQVGDVERKVLGSKKGKNVVRNTDDLPSLEPNRGRKGSLETQDLQPLKKMFVKQMPRKK